MNNEVNAGDYIVFVRRTECYEAKSDEYTLIPKGSFGLVIKVELCYVYNKFGVRTDQTIPGEEIYHVILLKDNIDFDRTSFDDLEVFTISGGNYFAKIADVAPCSQEQLKKLFHKHPNTGIFI